MNDQALQKYMFDDNLLFDTKQLLLNKINKKIHFELNIKKQNSYRIDLKYVGNNLYESLG